MQAFNEIKKNLKKDFSGFKKIKVAILSDSASQLLSQAIKGLGFEGQIDFNIFEAEYNQINLQVFSPNSSLYAFEPDFIIINLSSEHLLKEFYQTEKERQDFFFDEILETSRKYLETITKSLPSKVIINTYGEINDGVFGNFANKIKGSFTYQIRKINLLLMELSHEFKDVFICDLAGLQADLGYQFTFSPKMYISADLVYNIDFLPYIAKNLIDIIKSVQGNFKKCLIFDLDNTLWGGIIGDDGMEGIELGDFKLGKAFTELQFWAKQLKQRGIILAVCSKNTDSIAREPFEKHPEMVLKLEDFAVFVANWETKVDNIHYIQSILNIGYDSMVFIDDSRFEREMIKAAIPEITVPELPEDPAEYLACLRRLNLFETTSLVEEDANRTKLYQLEAERSKLRLSYTHEEDFLASLEMVAEVSTFNKFTIPRVAQLTQRSNQFNLRTIRYSEVDIANISNSSEHFSFSITLEDKFGSYGLVAVVILKKVALKSLFIDTWLMSCRVLGRQVEDFTLNSIVSLAMSNNLETIVGEYIPTSKNGIVRDHYKNLGFRDSDGKWILNIKWYEERKTQIVNSLKMGIN